MQPMQPIILDSEGIVRFKANEIVRAMLAFGREGTRFDLNLLAALKFSREDREQFAQLIGYSVSGYGELHYVSKESVKLADREAERLLGIAEEAT